MREQPLFFVAFFLMLGIASSAHGQPLQATKNAASTETYVEMRPMVALPGSGAMSEAPTGFGVGFERREAGHWQIVGELSYMQLVNTESSDLAASRDGGSMDAVGEGFVPTGTRTRLGAITALAGVRYYTQPRTNSWYADGKTGLELADLRYEIAGFDIMERSTAVPLVFEGGYRWMVEQKMSLRLGARGGDVARLSRSIRTLENSEHKSEIENEVKKGSHPNLTAAMVCGFGYKF